MKSLKPSGQLDVIKDVKVLRIKSNTYLGTTPNKRCWAHTQNFKKFKDKMID
jgi:hypothetical protein